MKFPEWLTVFGDVDFRGECPPESAEQMTFFNEIRNRYPDTIGRIAVHPKNEEKRSGRKFAQLAKDKAMGLSTGASDIIIPGCPAFVCEMKREDHTKSKFQEGQIEYLEASKRCGAFVCVALGHKGALEALDEWLKLTTISD